MSTASVREECMGVVGYLRLYFVYMSIALGHGYIPTITAAVRGYIYGSTLWIYLRHQFVDTSTQLLQ